MTTTLPDLSELILLELDFEVEEPKMCQVVYMNEGAIQDYCGKVAVVLATCKCHMGHRNSVHVCSDCLAGMVHLQVVCGTGGCKLPVIVVGTVNI